MGALFETQAFEVSDPSTSNTAYTAASGDSLVNRFFQDPAKACLISFDRQGTTKGYYRVRSPLLYDNVKGIHIAVAGGQGIFSLQAKKSVIRKIHTSTSVFQETHFVRYGMKPFWQQPSIPFAQRNI